MGLHFYSELYLFNQNQYNGTMINVMFAVPNKIGRGSPKNTEVEFGKGGRKEIQT
jgi:hypothetical protein